MTEKFIDVLRTQNGVIRFKLYRTATVTEAGQYNLRPGNNTPVRDVNGATLPMPTLVTATDISTNGFKLVIDGNGTIYEVSDDTNKIIAVTTTNETTISGKTPNSTTTLSVVSVRSNGQYSQPYFLTVKTKAEQNLYPYNVGDSEPTRTLAGTLTQPSQVAISFISNTTARISWSQSGSELYEVSVNGVINAITSQLFVDTPILENTVYVARVRAINLQGEYSEASQDTGQYAPPPPSTTTFTADLRVFNPDGSVFYDSAINAPTIERPLPTGTIATFDGNYEAV